MVTSNLMVSYDQTSSISMFISSRPQNIILRKHDKVPTVTF